jgi:hypothetical protein
MADSGGTNIFGGSTGGGTGISSATFGAAGVAAGAEKTAATGDFVAGGIRGAAAIAQLPLAG